MDKQTLIDKIDRLEQEFEELRKQAESQLSYMRGQIAAYKELLAELEEGEAETAE